MATKNTPSKQPSKKTSLAGLKQLYERGDLPEVAYRAAVAALKQAKSTKAKVKGSGAVAQGTRATAASGGGIAIGGNFEGNLYVGPPPKNETEAIRHYCEMLVAKWRALPLQGISKDATDATRGTQPLRLDQVYVNLDTTARVPVSEKTRMCGKASSMGEPEESKVLGGLKAIASNQRCVVLGDPGSGKSTFLNHLGLCLALNTLDSKGKWLARLPEWPQKTAKLIPIPVTLRDFAQSLPKEDAQAHARHLWEFIGGQLHNQNLDAAAQPLEKLLNAGQAIVMLDGLDEVPTQQQRTFIRDAVKEFSHRYPKCRLVVTCRILSYQDVHLQLPGIPVYELAAFSEEKIDRFIEAWYRELDRVGTVKSTDVKELTRKLKEAVRRPDLWRLAPNPLLLTVMAGLHAHKGRLPDARALLYEETIDILLSRWDEVKNRGAEGPQLRQLLLQAKRTDVDLKRVLRLLAFDAHQQAESAEEDSLADISEHSLIKALAELHPQKSHDWALQVINVIKLRAGLLLERSPEVYTFPHRTFQEYLAGAHIATQTNFAKTALHLLEEGTYWEQVVLLAVGRLVYHIEDFERPLPLVAELCPQTVHSPDDRIWHKIWFAGKVLNEIGVNRVQDSQYGQELWKRVQHQMVALLRQSALTPVERAKAGNTLAELGDPRFLGDAFYLPDEPVWGFVDIPEGPFIMGSQEGNADEKPQHEVRLPQYYIGRYPVTVSQFKAFVDHNNYKLQDPESIRGNGNHPVVNISWHEALAYCEWLTERLRESEETEEPLAILLRRGDGKGGPWSITLPSEGEWEKASRGTDGRVFPWGSEPDPNKANYNVTGILTTSAVGCFPGGGSPYGLEDMSGNVWEWTRSLFQEYPYPEEESKRFERERLDFNEDRVLRGGSDDLPDGNMRCASRIGYPPNDGNFRLGFRVVASPFSSP